MSQKYYFHRIHIRRSYTIQEVSGLLDISKRTVQRWLGIGLLSIDPTARPILIAGTALKQFVKNIRQSKKISLEENQFYCLKCKYPVEVEQGSELYKTTGKIIRSTGKDQITRIGICRVCKRKVMRFAKCLPKPLNDFSQ